MLPDSGGEGGFYSYFYYSDDFKFVLLLPVYSRVCRYSTVEHHGGAVTQGGSRWTNGCLAVRAARAASKLDGQYKTAGCSNFTSKKAFLSAAELH